MTPRARIALGLAMAIAAVSAVFVIWPNLDLIASQIPFDETRGRFPDDAPLLTRLRMLGQWLIGAGAIVALGGLLAGIVRHWFAMLPRPPLPGARAAIYLLAVLLLGPGLLVNTVFKDEWGRARPRQIEAFGGELVFTPAWMMSDQCPRNCSFVSGEAAGASWAFAWAALATRRRRLAFTVAGAYAALMAGVRFAMGGHFLSDSLLAILFTGFVATVVHAMVFPPTRDGTPHQGVVSA